MSRFIFTNLLSLLAIIFTINSANAQEIEQQTVTGMVVDHKGNPIPGATVRIDRTSTFTTTDIDGNFSIEVPDSYKRLTISYPGFADNNWKIKKNSDRPVRLIPADKTHSFISLMFANVFQLHNCEPYIQHDVQQLGLMFGGYRSWGVYAKVMIGVFGGPNMEYYQRLYPYPTVTLGSLKTITGWLNGFAGVGLGWNYGWYNGKYYEDYSLLTGCAEAGLMGKWKKLNLVAGVTYVFPPHKYNGNDGNLAVFAGVGLNF